MIEGGHLIDLGLRHAQLLGQRRQMAGAQLAVAVVDAMQVFDQQFAPARRVPQQCAHLGQRGGIDAPALGLLAPAFARGRRRDDGNDFLVHGVPCRASR